MTIEQWLEDAKSDAYRRKLPDLASMLETLAQATAALRAADWNDDASRDPEVDDTTQASSLEPEASGLPKP